MQSTALWLEVYRCIETLRNTCARTATFRWLSLVLVCMIARPDLAGVTSFVRAGWLKGICYRRLLYLFHTKALRLDSLTMGWMNLAQALFPPMIVAGYRVFVADGLKIPKEGKKMPAVKSLHVSSTDNSKATFIMGHSFQAISFLVQSATQSVFAVPLLSRITEGLVFSNRDKRTLLDKFLELFSKTVCRSFDGPLLLIADSYYASGKIIRALVKNGNHLVTRARINAVAYTPAEKRTHRRKGRQKLYGPKVFLRKLFDDPSKFTAAGSPIYGEKDVLLLYRSIDLVWKSAGRVVRFVLVLHPTRGRVILMCSDPQLDPLTIIRLYGFRFKIELSFKQAIHTIGSYAYHFWMKDMTPIKRKSGNQHLHRKNEAYRQAVRRKMDAYHRYVQLECIAQGILHHLAVNFRTVVWSSFRSWLRTMKPELSPSELVTSMALRTGLPEFLHALPENHDLKKMILENADPNQMPEFIDKAA